MPCLCLTERMYVYVCDAHVEDIRKDSMRWPGSVSQQPGGAMRWRMYQVKLKVSLDGHIESRQQNSLAVVRCEETQERRPECGATLGWSHFWSAMGKVRPGENVALTPSSSSGRS